MIGLVEVLYNPTKQEVKNINKYKKLVDYIVIVDNSDEENLQMLMQENILNEKILYYPQGCNIGLCKALNFGVKKLEELNCKWALLIDSDSEVVTDITSVYMKIAEKNEKKNVAIYTPVHIFDRSRNKPYIGCKEIEWSMTSGWCVDVEIFMKLGGFYEELFVDGLDMDYCFKTKKNGYRIVECGEAVIKHHPAETREFLGIRYGFASPIRYYMQARQLIWDMLYYKKYKLLVLYMYKWAKVFLFFPSKIEYIKNMINGTKEGFGLYKTRRKNGE